MTPKFSLLEELQIIKFTQLFFALFIAPLLILITSSSLPLLIFVCYLIIKTNQARKIWLVLI
jgi:hypothetical protein